jgi:hypothetical protein
MEIKIKNYTIRHNGNEFRKSIAIDVKYFRGTNIRVENLRKDPIGCWRKRQGLKVTVVADQNNLGS